MNALSGVFREEVPAMFLALMCRVAHDYLRRVHAAVAQKYVRTDPLYAQVYGKCLRDVNAWSPSDRTKEVNAALEQQSCLPGMYERSYVACLREVVQPEQSEEPQFPDYQVPSFEEFFVLFLMRLAKNPHVQRTNLLESCSPEEFSFLVLTVIREVFVECIIHISLRLPLTASNLRAHEAEGTVRGNQRRRASTASSSVASAASQAQSKTSTKGSTKGSTRGSNKTSAVASSAVSSVGSSKVSSKVSSKTSSRETSVSSKATSHTSSEVTHKAVQAPAKTPVQAPAQAPAQAPVQAPPQAPALATGVQPVEPTRSVVAPATAEAPGPTLPILPIVLPPVALPQTRRARANEPAPVVLMQGPPNAS